MLMNILRVVLGVALVAVLAAVVTNFVGESREVAKTEAREMQAERVELAKELIASKGSRGIEAAAARNGWELICLKAQILRQFSENDLSEDGAQKIAELVLKDPDEFSELRDQKTLAPAPDMLSNSTLKALIKHIGLGENTELWIKIIKFDYESQDLIDNGGTEADVAALAAPRFFNDELNFLETVTQEFGGEAGAAKLEAFDSAVYDAMIEEMLTRNPEMNDQIRKIVGE